MSAPESEGQLVQAPSHVLVGQALRQDLLTYLDFGDILTVHSGWYTSWQNFRDFTLNDRDTWQCMSRATVRNYAHWAFFNLARDALGDPEVGLRSVIIERADKRKYPRDFGVESDKEILLDPDSLIVARQAGRLSLLKRRGLPLEYAARDTLSRYVDALQSSNS